MKALILGSPGAPFELVEVPRPQLVEAGKLRPMLDSRTFTLKNAAAAHDLIEPRQAKGKLVVEID